MKSMTFYMIYYFSGDINTTQSGIRMVNMDVSHSKYITSHYATIYFHGSFSGTIQRLDKIIDSQKKYVISYYLSVSKCL